MTGTAAAHRRAAAGTPVTAKYLRELRAGKKATPSLALVARLADLFGVSLDTFSPHPHPPPGLRRGMWRWNGGNGW